MDVQRFSFGPNRIRRGIPTYVCRYLRCWHTVGICGVRVPEVIVGRDMLVGTELHDATVWLSNSILPRFVSEGGEPSVPGPSDDDFLALDIPRSYHPLAVAANNYPAVWR
jgi:hypothetical protein